MGRPTFLLLLGLVAVASWFVFKRYEIHGLDELRVARRDESQRSGSLPPNTEDSIRIASFNLEAFGPTKVGTPEVMELLVQIIHHFDLVAVQEVRSKNPDVLRSLLDHINASGRHYDMVEGPRVGRTISKEQFVYLFDRESIEVDRNASYTVEDPDDLLHRPPFVACFRARGPPDDEAFTFTLVNVHTDPDEVEYEIEALDDVFCQVRADGRGEDDVIMLGDFNADDQHMGQLGRLSGVTAAISGKSTNTKRTRQYDNLMFQMPASSEYTGRSGVFDFMREYNLTLDQALAVTDHLPVWAEFSVREDGTAPAVASQEPPSDVQTR